MILIPYKRRIYYLNINEENFIKELNGIIKNEAADYRGFFADANKKFRGNFYPEKKKFLIERNLGSLRGFKPFFDGKYSSENSNFKVEIITKADLMHYLLFLGIVTFLLFMMLASGTIIYTIHGAILIYGFMLAYFHYDTYWLLNIFESTYNKFIIK